MTICLKVYILHYNTIKYKHVILEKCVFYCYYQYLCLCTVWRMGWPGHLPWGGCPGRGSGATLTVTRTLRIVSGIVNHRIMDSFPRISK